MLQSFYSCWLHCRYFQIVFYNIYLRCNNVTFVLSEIVKWNICVNKLGAGSFTLMRVSIIWWGTVSLLIGTQSRTLVRFSVSIDALLSFSRSHRVTAVLVLQGRPFLERVPNLDPYWEQAAPVGVVVYFHFGITSAFSVCYTLAPHVCDCPLCVCAF